MQLIRYMHFTVQTLDGQILLPIDHKYGPRIDINNVREKIEKVLQIPQELLVLLSENKILTDYEDLCSFTDAAITLCVKGTVDIRQIYICRKYNLEFFPNPVSIQTMHGRELLECRNELNLTIAKIKDAFFHKFRIPTEAQVLIFREVKDSALPDNQLVTDLYFTGKFLRKQIKLTVVIRGDGTNYEFFNEGVITMIRPIVIVSHGMDLVRIPPNQNVLTALDVKQNIEQQLGFPVNLQILSDVQGKLLKDSECLFTYFLTDDLSITLTAKSTADNRITAICKENNINVLDAIPIRRSQSDILAMYCFEHGDTVIDLKLFVEKQYGIPVDLQVISDGNRLVYEDPTNLLESAFRGEEMKIYLTVKCNCANIVVDDICSKLKLSQPKSVERFCKSHNVCHLKRVTVKSLTCDVQNINVIDQLISDVESVKKFVHSKSPRLPIHLQEMLFQKRIVENHESVLKLYIEGGGETDELVFNLVMKPGSAVVVHLCCPLIQISSDKRTFQAVETDTILQIKEKVEGLSGIPASRLDVFNFHHNSIRHTAKSLRDESIIYESKVDISGRFVCDLSIKKFIMVEIHEDLQETVRFRYHIEGVLTANDLKKYIYFTKDYRQRHQKLILMDTAIKDDFLGDINPDAIHFHVIHRKKNCVVS